MFLRRIRATEQSLRRFLAELDLARFIRKKKTVVPRNGWDLGGILFCGKRSRVLVVLHSESVLSRLSTITVITGTLKTLWARVNLSGVVSNL